MIDPWNVLGWLCLFVMFSLWVSFIAGVIADGVRR